MSKNIFAFASFLVLAGALSAEPSLAQTVILKVGPGLTYTKPSQALAKAVDGARIEIQAGTYTNDPLCIIKNNVTLIGVGGKATFLAKPLSGQTYPPTSPIGGCSGKGILVTKGKDAIIDNINFTGMKVSSGNGAGIRAEGANLTIRNSAFYGNENGILANENLASTITITDSSFYNNGRSDGMAHNIYINPVKSLIVRNIVSHHAKTGHLLKTRSRQTEIVASRFYDDSDGNSSYALDISGGIANVTGNYFQKGPKATNQATVVNFYTSRDPSGSHQLTVSGNSFVSYLPVEGAFVRAKDDGAVGITGLISNNVFMAKHGPVISGGRTRDYNSKPIVAPTSVLAATNALRYVDDTVSAAQAIANFSLTSSISGQELLCTTLGSNDPNCASN